MRKKLKHLISVLVVLFWSDGFALPGPPPPQGAPVVPGLPIDSSLYVLFWIGILFIIVTIRRKQSNKIKK